MGGFTGQLQGEHWTAKSTDPNTKANAAGRRGVRVRSTNDMCENQRAWGAKCLTMREALVSGLHSGIAEVKNGFSAFSPSFPQLSGEYKLEFEFENGTFEDQGAWGAKCLTKRKTLVGGVHSGNAHRKAPDLWNTKFHYSRGQKRLFQRTGRLVLCLRANAPQGQELLPQPSE